MYLQQNDPAMCSLYVLPLFVSVTLCPPTIKSLGMLRDPWLPREANAVIQSPHQALMRWSFDKSERQSDSSV